MSVFTVPDDTSVNIQLIDQKSLASCLVVPVWGTCCRSPVRSPGTYNEWRPFVSKASVNWSAVDRSGRGTYGSWGVSTGVKKSANFVLIKMGHKMKKIVVFVFVVSYVYTYHFTRIHAQINAHLNKFTLYILFSIVWIKGIIRSRKT